MKAMAMASWAAGEPLRLVELPTPAVGPRDVRVAVKFAGVNPVDWKMRSQGPLRLAARALAPPPPVVLGVDFAGIVEAVGSAVTSVKAGDRVVGGTDFSRGQRGSLADTVVVRADQVAPVPDEVPLDVAGALPIAGVTAWRSVVELARVMAGKRVLILGASGGVGQLAVQVAKNVQRAFVVGVCSARNVAFVRGLGADEVIDYGAGDPLDQARAFGPYDAVIDCVGGYAGGRCRALLGANGRHVMVSPHTPDEFAQLVIAPLTARTLLGRVDGAAIRPILGAVAAGQVEVRITDRFPLERAEEAHQLSQAGRSTGKIVIEMGG